MNLTKSRTKKLNQILDKDKIISDRTYNFVMGGVVLYGLVLNVIMYLLFGDMMSYINPIIFVIGYFVVCFTGIFIAYKSKNPVICFIGYNMVVVPIGMVISPVIEVCGGLNSEIVIQAFVLTSIITFVMVFLSIVYPQFFSGLGKMLFIALIGLFIAEVICLILGIQQIITSWIGAIIFSLYIGYNFWYSQQCNKTLDNAVYSALSLYINIINLFIDILKILADFKSKD